MQESISIINTDTDADIDRKLSDYSQSIKRKAAFHEAGHAVAFIKLGASFCKCLLTSASMSTTFDIVGKSRTYLSWGGSAEHPIVQKEHVGSLAGFIAARIAKCIESNECLSYSSLIATFRDIESQEISDSDRAGVGILDESEFASAIGNAISILSAEWEMVQKVASILIESDSVTLTKCGERVLLVKP